MNYEPFSLCDLRVGKSAFVDWVSAGNEMSRRLLDLGLIPGTRVCCVAVSPAGDPSAYLVRGAVIALRRRDARGIAMVSAPERVGHFSRAAPSLAAR